MQMEQQRNQSQQSPVVRNPLTALTQTLQRLNDGTTEIAVADCVGEVLQHTDMTEAVSLMIVAYGKEYAVEYKERLQLLYGMILEDGWSKKRFMDTLKFLIKTRPYRDWTVSDFFAAPTAKLVSYEKAGKGFVPYQVGKFILWAEPHVQVPFEKVVSPRYAHMENLQY
jgi:hypothetical protein